ncbi:MAG: peptidoglycan DD-metalloendopeptidase family protein [Spirochaetes bacterium]|nr:peptidoglycan DD-metalloendopeptidase family protein [Spirochaetota bacterium]
MVDNLKNIYYTTNAEKDRNWIKIFFIDFLGRNMNRFFKSAVKFYHTVNKKGSEHLTVMLIPHSEKKIFRLHIKNFTLFFAAILILIIIVISTLNILSTSTSQQEMKNLIRLSQAWKLKESLITKQIDSLNSKIEDLKPEIEELFASASSKEDFVNLYAKGGSSDISVNIPKEKLQGKLPDEYYDLEHIKNDIDLSKKYIERVRNFIKEREKLFSKIPSIWPLKVGGYITSDYGWRKHPFRRRKTEFHKGIDIASWPGAPITATAEGTVKFSGWRGGYGLTVIIKHEYGFETQYAHLSRIRAFTGKKIKRGDIIGFLGKTGVTTGYHLHYEVRIGLSTVNPWPYIINIK